MQLVIFLLICVVVYLFNLVSKLKSRIDLAEKFSAIEHRLIRNFIRKSNVLKEDLEKYKQEPFFDAHWKDSFVFGEQEDALIDKLEFEGTLKEKEYDLFPDPELPKDEKAKELLNAEVFRIINSIQSANPKAIDEPYADWFKTKSDFGSMMISLRWMIPEIENRLIKSKIVLPEDFVRLKDAMVAGDLSNLMPNLFEDAESKAHSN